MPENKFTVGDIVECIDTLHVQPFDHRVLLLGGVFRVIDVRSTDGYLQVQDVKTSAKSPISGIGWKPERFKLVEPLIVALIDAQA